MNWSNSQGPRHGCVKPVQYIIVSSNMPLSYKDGGDGEGVSIVDHMELAYQLTHAYPNFAGCIKVPAVTRYAEAHALSYCEHLTYVCMSYYSIS